MTLTILGTDHTLQVSDYSLRNLVASLAESEKIALIGEEYPSCSPSVASQVAQSKGILWVQIDMTAEDRRTACIDGDLSNRMQIRGYDEYGMPVQAVRYAPREDGVREEFWLDRIAQQQVEGAALMICGALHARKVSEKAQQRGYPTRILFFPELPGSQFWVSIQPELF